MEHAFLEGIAEQLATRGVAKFRYRFPYTERGRRRPDTRPVLIGTVRSAVSAAAQAADGLPLFAGGKSMGGRMTSLAAAEAPLAGVRGLVFLGFPLHAAGRPGTERGEHLAAVKLPMLFVQGTRDRLAEPAMLRPLCGTLGGRATLHEIEAGDHSFRVPRRTGRSPDEVLEEIASVVSAWTEEHRDPVHPEPATAGPAEPD
jgi:predicted alpha/beta-hydrolase family hydrolase